MVQYRDRDHYGATQQRIGRERFAVPTAFYEVSLKDRQARLDIDVFTGDLLRPFNQWIGRNAPA
jgi:hypothetical protein